jgi:Fe2+ transport system protein FeoA
MQAKHVTQEERFVDNNGPQYTQSPQYPQTPPSSQGTQLSPATEQYRTFVIGQLKAGIDTSTITQKLMGMGLDGGEAIKLIDSVKIATGPIITQEQLVPTSFPMAIIGGMVAAIIGGSLWGLIVIITGFEIGYAAIGVGFLCGLGVRMFAKGQINVPFQAIAVLSSIFGIVIGNYAIFVHFARKAITQEFGQSAAATLPWVSGATMSKFCHAIPLMFSGKDAFFSILWIIIAIAAAVKALDR